MTTIEKAIESCYKRYKCLQNEDMYLKLEKGYVSIFWHVYMDRYISIARVKQIAKRLRKHTDLPIYSSFGLIRV